MFEKFLIDLVLIGGLPLLFLLVLFEGNPFVGSFIPGQFIVILLGVLIGTSNLFSLWVAFIVILLGAFLGDCLGYWWGKHPSALPFFKINHNSIIYKSSQSFFNKFGSFALILGREFNLTRAFIPFFAGVSKMKSSSFYSIAFLSNVLWTGISLYLGYIFGYVVVEKVSFVFGLSTLVIVYIIIFFLVYRFYKKYFFEDLTLKKHYHIHSLVNVSILMGLFLVILAVEEFGESLLYASYSFSYIYLHSSVAYFFSFLFHPIFVVCVFFFVFLYELKLKRTDLVVFYISSLLLAAFFSLIMSFMLKKILGFQVLTSLVFWAVFVLFLYLIFFRRKRVKRFYTIYIYLFLLYFLVVYVKLSIIKDFLRVFVSIISSAILCELLLLFHHISTLSRRNK